MNIFDSRLNRRHFLKNTAALSAAFSVPFFRTGATSAQELPADITDMNASQLSAAIRARRVSCVEVMQAYLERIHQYNPV